jgi:MATE family multidrug resistance protein
VTLLTHPKFREEVKNTVRLGLPIIAAQLAHIALGFIDTVMAGNLSAKDLGAVAIGRSLYMPLLVFVLGVLLAINPIVAQFRGAMELDKIGKTVRQGLWLSQMIAIPSFFLVRNIHVVMDFMNVAPEVIPITRGYLEAVSWSLPAAFAYLVLRFFNEGISLAKPNMYFTTLAIPINIVGNYAFMYGNWGFPRMGAVGTGWATTTVWWMMLGGMLFMTLTAKTYKPYSIFNNLRLPQWEYFKEVLRIGIPNGISIGLEISMFAITALIVGTLGVISIAAHQIAINFASITFMIPLGLSIATTSRVGYAIGKKDAGEAKLAGQAGMVISAFVMLLTAVTMLVIPEWISRIYTDDTTVIELAVQLLILAAVFQISDGLQVSGAGALRGLKDTKIPMFVNLIAYWMVGLPFGYYLGIIQGMGARGLWTGWIAGLGFTAISHPVRFFLQIKKIKFSEKPVDAEIR